MVWWRQFLILGRLQSKSSYHFLLFGKNSYFFSFFFEVLLSFDQLECCFSSHFLFLRQNFQANFFGRLIRRQIVLDLWLRRINCWKKNKSIFSMFCYLYLYWDYCCRCHYFGYLSLPGLCSINKMNKKEGSTLKLFHNF